METKKDCFLDEEALRNLIEDSLDNMNARFPGEIKEIDSLEFVQRAINVLQDKQTRKLAMKSVVKKRPLQIKNTPAILSRTQGYLPDLQAQLEMSLDMSKEAAEKYVGIFRDKTMLQLEDGEDPKSVSALIVDFAKKMEGQTWNFLALRNFEKGRGTVKVKCFFDRNLSQGDTQSNLWFFFSEKKKFFEKQLGELAFEKFKASFEWKNLKKIIDEEKTEAGEAFLREQNSPWRANDMEKYSYKGRKPLRCLEQDIVRTAKEKKCSKLEAYKIYFKYETLPQEQKDIFNLFIGKWGNWEQEGRFLTHFLNQNPGVFNVNEITKIEIGGVKIGRKLYKGIFTYLFPEAKKNGFARKEWPYIFAHLINKGFLDLNLFLENPFSMKTAERKMFQRELEPCFLENMNQKEKEKKAEARKLKVMEGRRKKEEERVQLKLKKKREKEEEVKRREGEEDRIQKRKENIMSLRQIAKEAQGKNNEMKEREKAREDKYNLSLKEKIKNGEIKVNKNGSAWPF